MNVIVCSCKDNISSFSLGKLGHVCVEEVGKVLHGPGNAVRHGGVAQVAASEEAVSAGSLVLVKCCLQKSNASVMICWK